MKKRDEADEDDEGLPASHIDPRDMSQDERDKLAVRAVREELRKTTRITVDLTSKQYKRLTDISETAGVTKASVIRNSIILAEYVTKAQEANGKITITFPDGKSEELLILWTLGGIAIGR